MAIQSGEEGQRLTGDDEYFDAYAPVAGHHHRTSSYDDPSVPHFPPVYRVSAAANSGGLLRAAPNDGCPYKGGLLPGLSKGNIVVYLLCALPCWAVPRSLVPDRMPWNLGNDTSKVVLGQSLLVADFVIRPYRSRQDSLGLHWAWDPIEGIAIENLVCLV